ncbi:hypothetical protein KWV16_01130 [Clostridioides difficile]|nr:hypothetical protein [Clostridioides difficile]
MGLIQLKIKKDNFWVKYIKIIRKFDNSLSVNVIKQRIENDDFVMRFDLEHYDVLEELNEIDKKEVFRNMIGELLDAGANTSIYENVNLSSLEFLDNWIKTLNQINLEVEKDMDREIE